MNHRTGKRTSWKFKRLFRGKYYIFKAPAFLQLIRTKSRKYYAVMKVINDIFPSTWKRKEQMIVHYVTAFGIHCWNISRLKLRESNSNVTSPVHFMLSFEALNIISQKWHTKTERFTRLSIKQLLLNKLLGSLHLCICGTCSAHIVPILFFLLMHSFAYMHMWTICSQCEISFTPHRGKGIRTCRLIMNSFFIISFFFFSFGEKRLYIAFPSQFIGIVCAVRFLARTQHFFAHMVYRFVKLEYSWKHLVWLLQQHTILSSINICIQMELEIRQRQRKKTKNKYKYNWTELTIKYISTLITD